MTEISSTPDSQKLAQLHQYLIELESAKAQYRAIVQTVGHVIIGLKPDYTIFEWNQSAEKLYGCTRTEVLGANYLERFLPEAVRANVAEDIAKVLAGMPTKRFENPVLTQEGVKIILWNVTRLLDEQNQPYGVIAIGQNITAYKEAEAEAQKNAHKYRQLLADEQRHVRDLALLDRVRTVLARELNLNELLRLIVDAIADTFGYTLVSLYLLVGETLVLQHQVGYEQVIHEIPLNLGVSGRVARTGEPILLRNVHDDAAFLGAIEGIVSQVTVPLFDQGKVAGTLNVESIESVELTQDDLNLMGALSEHISIAIERARLHTEVSRSESRFRVMFELAPIGLAISRLDGRFLQVNRAFCRILGYTAAELLTFHAADISHDEDMAVNQLLHDEMIAGKRSRFGMDKRYITKDGRILHTILQVVLVTDDDGTPLYSIGQIVDITDRIQIEKAEREQRLLAETLSRVGLALSATLDLPALLNLICRESVNLFRTGAAFVWLTEGDEMVGFAGYGYGREKFLQLRVPKSDETRLATRIVRTNRPEYVNDALHSDKVDTDLMHDYQCLALMGVPLAKGDEVIGALMILELQRPFRFDDTDLKTAVVLGSYAAVAIENARLYNDLEKRVAERTYDLQSAYEELKKLDKLKSKLIDDISHELRTPTTNINLYLDLMIKGNPQRRSHYQEVMRSEITRLEKLVAGIIQLSEFDTLRTQMRLNPVRLNHIAQQVAATFAQAAADKKLVLSLNLAADLPLVAGDEKQLTEAVRHLMANAINYTHTGHIHLRTFTETAVCLTITDTGMGIADDDLPHIFDRFYRGQSVSQLTFPGAGLGLCVVEEIVKLHGGEVTVTSQLGQGSTFAICLPAA